MDRSDIREVLHFIDGERVPSADRATLDNFEPATGESLGTIAAGGAVEVDRATAAATRALPGWSGQSAEYRGGRDAAGSQPGAFWDRGQQG